MCIRDRVWDDPEVGLGRPGWFGKTRVVWVLRPGELVWETRLVREDPEVGLGRPGWFGKAWFGKTRGVNFGKTRL
eukprot:8255622-Pyramimonas_sp.AAC.1